MVRLPWRRGLLDRAPEDYEKFLAWLVSRMGTDVGRHIVNTIAAAADSFRDEVEECVEKSECGRIGAVIFACAARAAYRHGLINVPFITRPRGFREAARALKDARLLDRLLNEVAKRCYGG